MSCSLIISTYNWPQALSLCLQSVKQQKLLPDEVLIADDGSTEKTKQLIEHFQKNFPAPLKHVWHPDEGFRLAAIRNKAIAEARCEYIIQTDGDLILHSLFIRDHLEMKKPGYFTAGSRVMLSETTTKKLIENNSVNVKKYGAPSLDANAIRSKLLRTFLAERYKAKGRFRFYVKGCNMAFFKKDLLKVNGYNESFEGWGCEDREIAIRLMNSGIKKQFLKNGGICYHLYHSTPSKINEERNECLMKEAVDKQSTWVENGLSKYVKA